MKILSIDHIVLCVKDVAAACAIYERVLGMEPRDEQPGKWSLYFGAHKISLQEPGTLPAIARGTVPGSGNFCLLTDEPVEVAATRSRRLGVEIIDGPGERLGATGKLHSIYFNDPDGNLIELSNR